MLITTSLPFFRLYQANTPGCTTQACDFNDNYAEFGPLGYDGTAILIYVNTEDLANTLLSQCMAFQPTHLNRKRAGKQNIISNTISCATRLRSSLKFSAPLRAETQRAIREATISSKKAGNWSMQNTPSAPRIAAN